MLPLGSELEVLRVVFQPPDDQHILESAGDDQLTLNQRPEVAGTEERTIAIGEICAEGFRALFGASPIAACDAGRLHPDLADLALFARSRRLGIYDRDVGVEP